MDFYKSKPIIILAGSYKRAVVFGFILTDLKPLFRQYDKFDNITSVDYLIHIGKRFGDFVIFIDQLDSTKAHCSKIARRFLDTNNRIIELQYFQVDSDLNVGEEGILQTGQVKYTI